MNDSTIPHKFLAIALALTLALVSVAPTAPSKAIADEPNADFESRLARIYAEHSEPVSSERWSELIGARATESYLVQTGDTLWDLSRTLFGDGFYWSKLWAENPDIHNPHRIDKGQALRFIGGSESEAPELHVVQADSVGSDDSAPTVVADASDKLTSEANQAFEREDVVAAVKEVSPDEVDPRIVVEQSGDRVKTVKASHVGAAPYFEEDLEGKISQADLDAGAVIEQSEIVPRPLLPPPEARRKPLLNLPGTFVVRRPRLIDKSVEVKKTSRRADKEIGAVVPGAVAMEDAPTAVGVLDEIDSGIRSASLGQSVLVRAADSLSVGQKVYTVIERFSGRFGRAYEIGGIVEIRDLVDAGSRIYRGQVTYAVNPVVVGSKVLAGTPPRVPVTTKGRRNPASLTISGGGLEEDYRQFGDSSIVYFNRESADVRVGDVFAIQARRGERRSTSIPDQLTPIGIVKVFAVHGKSVSGIVVLATEEIRIGDRTGGEFPTRLPDFKYAAPKVADSSVEDSTQE